MMKESVIEFNENGYHTDLSSNPRQAMRIFGFKATISGRGDGNYGCNRGAMTALAVIVHAARTDTGENFSGADGAMPARGPLLSFLSGKVLNGCFELGVRKFPLCSVIP